MQKHLLFSAVLLGILAGNAQHAFAQYIQYSSDQPAVTVDMSVLDDMDHARASKNYDKRTYPLIPPTPPVYAEPLVSSPPALDTNPEAPTTAPASPTSPPPMDEDMSAPVPLIPDLQPQDMAEPASAPVPTVAPAMSIPPDMPPPAPPVAAPAPEPVPAPPPVPAKRILKPTGPMPLDAPPLEPLPPVSQPVVAAPPPPAAPAPVISRPPVMMQPILQKPAAAPTPPPAVSAPPHTSAPVTITPPLPKHKPGELFKKESNAEPVALPTEKPPVAEKTPAAEVSAPVELPPEAPATEPAPQAQPEAQTIEPATPPVAAAEPAPAPEEEKTFSPVPEESDLTLEFKANAIELSSGAQAKLKNVITQMNGTEGRLQVRAYASGEDGSKSSARRISLSRALAVRSFLMDNGIKPNRVDVRALGTETDRSPVDRVDLIFAR